MAQTAAERRRAQRKLAKDLKAGTPILPKSVTAQAKTTVIRESLVSKINAYKKRVYGNQPKYNQRGSNEATRRHPTTGKPRSAAELQHVLNAIERRENRDRGREDEAWDWSEYFDDEDDDTDYESALHYH